MDKYEGLPTDVARAYQAGAPDAYGNPPERAVSDGPGTPCRHCLRNIPAGAGMLILAHRPFGAPQPYAETGPIFLCADACPVPDPGVLPKVLTTSPDYLLKGYSADERIVSGSGRITPVAEIAAYAGALLADPRVAFADIRSARNNCWLVRVRPG
jgi:hypothetical protein